MKAIGIILIIGGMLLLACHVANSQQEKKLAELGPAEINKEENKTIEWPIYGGGLAIIAGLIYVAIGKKKNK